MMSTTYSTRVQAPNSLDYSVPDDVSSLNPLGRDATDDNSVEIRSTKHKINKKSHNRFTLLPIMFGLLSKIGNSGNLSARPKRSTFLS